jgi:hypothetical protein
MNPRRTFRTLVFFLVALAAAVPPLCAEEAAGTDAPRLAHTITLFPQLDLQRSLGPDFYLRATYDLLAWDHFRFTAGVSLSFTPFEIDGYFLELAVDDIAGTGLGAHCKAMNDQYPEYGRACNTINPYAVWRWRFVDLAFGVVWRFLVTDPAWLWCLFDYDPFMVEPIFYYKIGVVFDFFDKFWTLGVSLSNQDEFYVGNFGTFTLRFENRIAIDGHWSAFCVFMWRPAGTLALTAVNSCFLFLLGGRLAL